MKADPGVAKHFKKLGGHKLTTVELKEQPFAPTLAHKLGDVPHVSGLLRRIAQLSGAGERGQTRALLLRRGKQILLT